MARCPRLVGAGRCGREIDVKLNPDEWTPRSRLQPKPAVALGFLCGDEHRKTSAQEKKQKKRPVCVRVTSKKLFA